MLILNQINIGIGQQSCLQNQYYIKSENKWLLACDCQNTLTAHCSQS